MGQSVTHGENGSSPAVAQSKKESLIEAGLNVTSGFFLTLVLWQTVGPIFGYHVTLGHSFGITTIFTTVSIGRTYFWRRFFTRRASGGPI